jgi:hypothetical protein
MIDPKVPPDGKMTDEQLIEYVNLPFVTMDFQNKARFILHRKKTRSDKRMLIMTAAILILTMLLVYAELFHKSPSAPMTVPAKEIQPKQLKPVEKSQEPHGKGDKTNAYQGQVF